MALEAASCRLSYVSISGRTEPHHPGPCATPGAGFVPALRLFRRSRAVWPAAGSEYPRQPSCWGPHNLPAGCRVKAHLANSNEPADARSRDAMRNAAVRLKNLLSGVGDGEEELLNSVMEQEPPVSKVLLSVVAGGIIVTGCSLLCWLCGNDPAGGADISMGTLSAALIGLIAALPVVLLRRGLWSPEAVANHPVLRQFVLKQLDYYKPLVTGLSAPQTAVVLSMEVLPMVVFFLPTLMGCIMSSTGLYAGMVEKNSGLQMPDGMPCFFGLLVSSLLFGATKAGASSLSDDERTVVLDAIDNADRYYKVMSISGEPSSKDATLNSEAFKFVAQKWLTRNLLAASLAGVLGLFDMLYLGILWLATGNLMAPTVVALMAGAVDLDGVLRQQQESGNARGDSR